MGSEGSQVFVVTGASRGLGLEIVRQLLDEGKSVVAAVRNPDNAPNLKPLSSAFPSKLTIIRLDSADHKSIKDAAAAVEAKFPAIDCLYNNAGVSGALSLARDETADVSLEVFRTNVLGPLLTTQAFLPLLKKGSRKVVVNMSSGLGSIGGLQERMRGKPLFIDQHGLAYKMSKAALNMETVTLAVDLREDGVTVVAMDPGWVATDMGNASADHFGGAMRPPLDAATSVAGQLRVINSLTLEQTGSYLTYEGETVPF